MKVRWESKSRESGFELVNPYPTQLCTAAIETKYLCARALPQWNKTPSINSPGCLTLIAFCNCLSIVGVTLLKIVNKQCPLHPKILRPSPSLQMKQPWPLDQVKKSASTAWNVSGSKCSRQLAGPASSYVRFSCDMTSLVRRQDTHLYHDKLFVQNILSQCLWGFLQILDNITMPDFLH